MRSRRHVLRGVGGAFGALSTVDVLGGGRVSRIRRQIDELEREFGNLAELDVDDLDEVQRQRLAAAGEEIGASSGDCGPESIGEFDGGRFDVCCQAHDDCCITGPPCDLDCNAMFLACVGDQM